MENILVITFAYLIGIGLLLIFNELVYRRRNPTGELTRKFAHFAAVLATLPFPYIFPTHWYVLALALVFAALLFFTRKGKQLNSIHDIDRKSIGSYLLPLSIYTTFLISHLSGNKFIYILSMLILAICDPLAAILGINMKTYAGKIKVLGIRLNKTWPGSIAFLLSSFIISFIALYFHLGAIEFKTFWLALLIAITSMIAELSSWRGSDNLSVPISVVLILLLFL